MLSSQINEINLSIQEIIAQHKRDKEAFENPNQDSDDISLTISECY